MRLNISSNAPWEDIVGYSRAVIVNNIVHLSGTTATDDNGEVIDGGAYEQTIQCFRNIEKALLRAGSSLENVYRTRMYVTDITLWEEFGRAHGEFFKTIKPASTMVEVSALVNAKMLIEIEVEASI